MLDAGPAQPNQVDAARAVSLEDLAGGGDTRSAPSAKCAASSVTAAPGLQQLRSYEACPMPPDNGFRLYDREGVQNTRRDPIQADEDLGGASGWRGTSRPWLAPE